MKELYCVVEVTEMFSAEWRLVLKVERVQDKSDR